MTVVLERIWVEADRRDRFDRAIEGLVVALLAFMPLAFGIVHAWSEEVVIALAIALSVCFCLKVILVPGASVTWTWAYVPIAAFILLTVVQIIPLPVALVRLISPHTVSQKLSLLHDLDSSSGAPSSMTISFYVHATRHDLRLVLATAAVFFIVLNTIRSSDQIARLLGAVAIIGGVVAALALAQAAFGNGKLYWFIRSPHNVALSGPFVNHSHFAQFMNLSIGAALGLVLMRLHRRFRGRSVSPAIVAEYISSREGKVLLGLMLVVTLGATSIFVSLSRGGIISTLIAGAFTAVIIGLGRPMKGSGWVLALLALAAFICVLYVGFDAVYDRLGTLHDIDRAGGGRWQIVKDIAVAWTRFPLVGTGLGTHEVVYPMFDRSTVPALASHAENEYAQAAEETGLAGLLALTAFGTIVWASYVRAVRRLQHPTHPAAYGLGFGLMAIMIHSLSDFGQHLPANALLSAIFCAMLIRLCGSEVREDGATRRTADLVLTHAGMRRFGAVALATVGIVAAVVLADADAARRAEVCWTKTLRAERDLIESDWQGSDGEYAYLLSHAAKAQESQPANIAYGHWLNVYRWRAISRVSDPNTGEVIASPELLDFAGRIAEEQKKALRQCPTYGPTWTVLGQIERYVVSGSEQGARHILRGRQLAPNDPITCLVTGMLYAEQGKADVAFEHLKRAAELDGGLFAEVATLGVRTLDRPDLAVELASNNILRLMRVERIVKESGGHPELLAALSDRILGLLEQECRKPDAAAWEFAWLAQRYRQDGRIDEAVQTYRKALALEYAQVSERYVLAQLLAEQGLKSEAVRELEIVLRLRPQFEAAQRLLDRLTVQD